jgi:hypothetical protein
MSATSRLFSELLEPASALTHIQTVYLKTAKIVQPNASLVGMSWKRITPLVIIAKVNR